MQINDRQQWAVSERIPRTTKYSLQNVGTGRMNLAVAFYVQKDTAMRSLELN